MCGCGQGMSRVKVGGAGDALRKIVKVISVYCQTGTLLSSSGGITQVLLWDSQLYLGKVRCRKGYKPVLVMEELVHTDWHS